MKKLILSVLVGLAFSSAALAEDNGCGGGKFTYFDALNKSCQKLEFKVLSSNTTSSVDLLLPGQGKQIRVCSSKFQVEVCAKNSHHGPSSKPDHCTICTVFNPHFVVGSGPNSCGAPVVACF